MFCQSARHRGGGIADNYIKSAEIAQLVEHHLAKVGVASSSLVFRSILCGNSSVGRASPCQGGGREFESRFPLHIMIAILALVKQCEIFYQ